jgi:hypothetical protein
LVAASDVVQVLQEKLGLNKKHVAKGWRAVEGMEGTVCQVFEDGDVFGELAVLEGQTLEGTVTSEEQEPVVAVVTRPTTTTWWSTASRAT